MLGDSFRVLVGAGIAGLAAARTLRRYGIAVEEVDLAQGDLMIGAGICPPGDAERPEALGPVELAGTGLEESTAGSRPRGTGPLGDTSP